MTNFDMITEQCVIAQEGSTKDALNAMKSDNFKKAVSLMKQGKANNDASKFKEAKALFAKVRKEISSTRTWPISGFVGNSIIGTLYSWNTESEAIDKSVLYPDAATKAKAHQIVDAVATIVSSIPYVGMVGEVVRWGRHMITYFTNKDNNKKEAGKYFNVVCARMIQIVDLYSKSCDMYIEDLKNGKKLS